MTLIESWANFWTRRSLNPLARSIFPFTEAYIGAWCKVMQKYPRLVNLNPYAVSFVRASCPPLGYPDPPSPPPPPIIEAPCNGVQYDIVLNITRQFNNGSPSTYNSPILRIYGALQEIGIRQYPELETSFLQGFVAGFDENGVPAITTTDIGGVGFTATLNYYVISRTDGSPNNLDCYDPLADLPPDPEINPRDFTPVVPIPRQDEDGNPLPPLEIPITINLNPNSELNLDLTIEGDKYDIDYEGFKKRDPPSFTRTFPTKKPGDDGVFESPPVEAEEEAVEEVVTEEEELLWVLVDVVQSPRGGKTITFSSAEDIVYFAGYLSWIVPFGGSYKLPQEPIRKQRSAFKAPDGVSGYRIVSVNGAILSSRKYTQVVSTEE